MDDDAKLMSLEVDSVVADPKTMHDFAGAFELSEMFQIGAHDFLRQAPKFAEDVELQIFWHTRQLGGTGRIKDDLKRAHFLFGSANGNRTRLSALKGPCPSR